MTTAMPVPPRRYLNLGNGDALQADLTRLLKCSTAAKQLEKEGNS